MNLNIESQDSLKGVSLVEGVKGAGGQFLTI